MDKYQEILVLMEKYAVENRIPIISYDGMKLLCKTVRQHNPSKVLEIGTAIGYSTLLMATCAPGARITTIELNPGRAKMAKAYLEQAGLLDRIEILVGNAGEILKPLDGQFDMVFIDAAKGQYLDYLLKVMDKLLPNAVILADNVLFRGWINAQTSPLKRFRTIVKRLKAYLDFVVMDPRFLTTVYDCGDGIAISIYRGAIYGEKT